MALGADIVRGRKGSRTDLYWPHTSPEVAYGTWATAHMALAQLMRKTVVPQDNMSSSRRKLFTRGGAVLGGLMIGMGLGQLIPDQSAHAETTQKPPPPKSFDAFHLQPDDAVSQLSQSRTLQRANQHFGEPNWNDVYRYERKDTHETGVVVFYQQKAAETGQRTFITIDDPASGPNTIGLVGRLTRHGPGEGELAWLTPDAELIGTTVFQGGQVHMVAAPHPPVRPDFNLGCWLYCMGSTDVDCAFDCLACFLYGPLFDLLDCIECALCAGSKGIECVRLCP